MWVCGPLCDQIEDPCNNFISCDVRYEVTIQKNPQSFFISDREIAKSALSLSKFFSYII